MGTEEVDTTTEAVETTTEEVLTTAEEADTTTEAVETTTEAVETTTEEETTTTPQEPVQCPEDDFGFMSFIRDPSDCSRYYVCSGHSAHPILMECPSPLLFDTSLNICNYPDQVDC